MLFVVDGIHDGKLLQLDGVAVVIHGFLRIGCFDGASIGLIVMRFHCAAEATTIS